jgi:hypothetical protein
VLVADDHVGAIEAVAAALQDAGLRIGTVLPTSGVISGAVEDEAALDALSAIEGVAAVERAQEIQLPPPDEEIQ